MAYDYNATHKKIIQSAKELFLKNGYERTNLREICSNAGVTNGAFYKHFDSKESLFSVLVQTCVEGFEELYSNIEKYCMQTLQKKGIEKAMSISYEAVFSLVNYIYDNFEEFKLLVICSDGTKYSRFIERVVEIEVKVGMEFFQKALNQGIKINVPEEKSIHMICHCYFNTIFECVVHDYEKDETLKQIKTLVTFFDAGWKKILGF